MIVCLSPDAEADLEEIGDFIAHDSPLRAVTFVKELRERCSSLAAMPMGFPLVPRYEDRGIRHRVHGSYQIFYRTAGDPVDRIDVLHIVHAARNFAALLF